MGAVIAGTKNGALIAGPEGRPVKIGGRFLMYYGAGSFGYATSPAAKGLVDAFRQGLREHGWVEGHNIVIEYRSVEGRVERFPSLAAELVSLKPDLLVALPNAGARAAKRTTNTIPIVMVYVFEPVRDGLMSLAEYTNVHRGRLRPA